MVTHYFLLNKELPRHPRGSLFIVAEKQKLPENPAALKRISMRSGRLKPFYLKHNLIHPRFTPIGLMLQNAATGSELDRETDHRAVFRYVILELFDAIIVAVVLIEGAITNAPCGRDIE